MTAKPVLLVHGGAWAIPDDAVESHQRGVRNAVNVEWSEEGALVQRHPVSKGGSVDIGAGCEQQKSLRRHRPKRRLEQLTHDPKSELGFEFSPSSGQHLKAGCPSKALNFGREACLPDSVATLDRVTQRYGKTGAVDDVTLTPPAARLVGLIELDGVGKSWLRAIISGTRHIQSGSNSPLR